MYTELKAQNMHDITIILEPYAIRFEDAFDLLEKARIAKCKAGNMYGSKLQHGFTYWTLEDAGAFTLHGHCETGAMGCYDQHYEEYTILFEDFFEGYEEWKVEMHNLIAEREKEAGKEENRAKASSKICLLYTSPSPRDRTRSRMPSSA